jgi:hypothetical protein
MTRSRLLGVLFSLLWVAGASADPLLVSKTADWANPDGVTENIKTECSLNAYQADSLREKLTAAGIEAAAAESNEVPKTGEFLLVRIESALSAGNAFMGHNKQVTTSAKLYKNGAEVAKTTVTRSSMGGFGGGYKGSCSVLARCAAATSQDIAKWVQEQRAGAAPAAAKP